MGQKSMLKQAFILTAGNIISRFLGLIYVFPFAWLVGQEGQALFSYAYVPYVIFIDLATLGVPLGVSKFISIYNAQNDYLTSYKIFKKSTILMLIIGVFMFLMMFLLSKPIAYQVLGGKTELINNIHDVTLVIRVISTALIVVPSIALLRGFFQGFKLARPTAMSQIIEQLTRVVFIILSAFIIVKLLNQKYTLAIYFAVSSATIAALSAYVVLRVQLHKFFSTLNPLLKTSVVSHQKSTYQLFKELFKYALPIAIFGIVSSLYLFIDTLTFNKAYLLKGVNNSEIIYGTYAFEINKLIMIPVSLGMGLGVSMLIYISESYTKKHYQMVNKQINKVLQTCTYIIVPIIIIMMIFPKAVYSLFYQASNPYGSRILLSFAPVAILLCFNHITNATMQGINKQRYLIISMIIGVCIKYLYNESLIQALGYNGAILSTTIGLLTTILINIFVMKYSIKFHHLYITRRLVSIFGLNIILGSLFYLMNFIVFQFDLNFDSRLNCFTFLLINSVVYTIIYLLISYITGLLDVITGREFKLKKILIGLRNKYVTNIL
ncbi:polysaccharide biosynthesis protein [Mycoplasmatota bacterium]|nr:polysaccharide biosynthesis protein [Mycoplasmatota bacterium]